MEGSAEGSDEEESEEQVSLILSGLTTGERVDLKAGQGSQEVLEKLKQTLTSSGTRYYFYNMRNVSTIQNGLALSL